MRIIFPHLPKCAGGSIRRQIEGRPEVVLDYFNHPTWRDEPDRVAGQRRQASLKAELRDRDRWLLFGHFAPAVYYDIGYELQILLLRRPLERAVSQYHFVRTLMADTPVARRRHPEVGAIMDGGMSIERFCALDHVRYFYSRFYLAGLHRDERLLALSTDDVGRAFRIIGDRAGIDLDHRVRRNRNDHAGDYEALRPLFAEDEALYRELLASFAAGTAG